MLDEAFGVWLWSEPLRENCPNTEFFPSVFSRTLVEYGDLLRKSLYSGRVRQNTDQKYLHLDNFHAVNWTDVVCICHVILLRVNFIILSIMTHSYFNFLLELSSLKKCLICFYLLSIFSLVTLWKFASDKRIS